MAITKKMYKMKKRFRGFLPVVVDVETAGLNPKTDALLEIAAVMVHIDEDTGKLFVGETHACHTQAFEGANLDPAALAINKIDPFHPFRFAIPEKQGLEQIFEIIQHEVDKTNCQRAVLVGHNPTFDLSFIQAAARRSKIHKVPFHRFTAFDTATLAGAAYGETVLARACDKAKIPFNRNEAHSAIYDAEQTAELFCKIVNRLAD